MPLLEPTLTWVVHPCVLQVTPHAVSGFSIKALRPGRGSVEFEYTVAPTGEDLVAELDTAAEVTALGLQTAVISIGLLVGALSVSLHDSPLTVA